MSVNDGFGLLVAFSVVAGVVIGELRWQRMKNKPVVEHRAKRTKKRKVDDDSSEFGIDDIDKDVDEMPDDSLIYDMFN